LDKALVTSEIRELDHKISKLSALRAEMVAKIQKYDEQEEEFESAGLSTIGCFVFEMVTEYI